MSRPVPLKEADTKKPFVYDRVFGLFYCDGSHQGALSLLLAFHHGETDVVTIAEKLNLEYSDETADYFLKNTPGVCFRSSCGTKIEGGKPGSLTMHELRIFNDDVEYLFT